MSDLRDHFASILRRSIKCYQEQRAQASAERRHGDETPIGDSCAFLDRQASQDVAPTLPLTQP